MASHGSFSRANVPFVNDDVNDHVTLHGREFEFGPFPLDTVDVDFLQPECSVVVTVELSPLRLLHTATQASSAEERPLQQLKA